MSLAGATPLDSGLSEMMDQAAPYRPTRQNGIGFLRAPDRDSPLRSRLAACVSLIGLTFGLAACTGETVEPSTQSDVLAITTTTVATTTTVPPETTTTINFDREPDQDDAPLPDDATASELFSIVDNMRGPTADASEQLQRLATFVDLASPIGAQIMDFSVAVEPVDDDRSDISTQVRMRTPQPTRELSLFYDGELRSAGWNKASFNDTVTDGMAGTELVFRIPGSTGAEAELTITISEGPTSIVDLDYTFLSEEDDPSFEQLAAWQAAIRTPRGTTDNKTVVFTEDDTVSIQVIYALEADTAAEAREDVLDLVRDDEFTVRSASTSGTSTAPLLLVDEEGQEFLLDFAPTRNPELFWMMVSATSDLTPVED